MIKIKCILFLTFFFTTTVFAQKPREVNLENDPVDFTNPANFIALVIIPLFLIVAGALIIRNRKKRKREKQD
jgi:surface polysaccharide O-acyltransferase-like enzyme